MEVVKCCSQETEDNCHRILQESVHYWQIQITCWIFSKIKITRFFFFFLWVIHWPTCDNVTTTNVFFFFCRVSLIMGLFVMWRKYWMLCMEVWTDNSSQCFSKLMNYFQASFNFAPNNQFCTLLIIIVIVWQIFHSGFEILVFTKITEGALSVRSGCIHVGFKQYQIKIKK